MGICFPVKFIDGVEVVRGVDRENQIFDVREFTHDPTHKNRSIQCRVGYLRK